MIFEGKTAEYLKIDEVDHTNCNVLKEKITDGLALLWFTGDDNQLYIDNQLYSFDANDIISLTEFHEVRVKYVSSVRLVRFNRPFYCVLNHDVEIGCKGVLFFGASQIPLIKLPAEEKPKFDTLWEMFVIEMASKDALQIEMLQMMLKRLLILCTRLYKEQENYAAFDKNSMDLVREFNFLVEQHFKEKHTVAEYADLLNKSPKTISNVFAKIAEKKPLQYIHERRMLEARRLLCYTDFPVKEIAFEIGFEDLQAFSRFFKKQEGISPTEYKKNFTEGKIAKS